MIKQHRIRIHNQVLRLRSLERALKSDPFEAAYSDATIEEKKKLDWILKSLHLENLRMWIAKINQQSIQTMSIRNLRELCKKYSVPYWSRLDKLEMIEEINACMGTGKHTID